MPNGEIAVRPGGANSVGKESSQTVIDEIGEIDLGKGTSYQVRYDVPEALPEELAFIVNSNQST